MTQVLSWTFLMLSLLSGFELLSIQSSASHTRAWNLLASGTSGARGCLLLLPQAETKFQSPSPCMCLLSVRGKPAYLIPLAEPQDRAAYLCCHTILGINLSLRLLSISQPGNFLFQLGQLLKLGMPVPITPLSYTIPWVTCRFQSQISGQLSCSSGGPSGAGISPERLWTLHLCFCLSLSAVLSGHHVGIRMCWTQHRHFHRKLHWELGKLLLKYGLLNDSAT